MLLLRNAISILQHEKCQWCVGDWQSFLRPKWKHSCGKDAQVFLVDLNSCQREMQAMESGAKKCQTEGVSSLPEAVAFLQN